MLFNQIFRNVINESMTAGGTASVLGSGVNSTATQFSGDNYAPGDARNVTGNIKVKLQRRKLPETVNSKKKRKLS